MPGMIEIGFDAVHRLAPVGALLGPLRRMFASAPPNLERAQHALSHDSLPLSKDASRTLLLMPAWRPGGAIGVKIVTVFPDNARRGDPTVNAAYVLLSGDSGAPRAWIDGRALTLLRTAAVSALAADLLAPADPQVLLMVGTGAMSRYLIEAHLAVRRYGVVRVWGRDFGKAAAVSRDLAAKGIPVEVAADLQSAARAADVISCATLASQPLLHGAWLKAEVHIDLVGSFRPDMREADDECLRGACVVVDSPTALEESGDLIEPLAHGVLEANAIATLGALAARGPAPQPGARTVFKSVGVAAADLAVAEYLVERRAIRDRRIM
jgi:ornithine cyclodeaminase